MKNLLFGICAVLVICSVSFSDTLVDMKVGYAGPKDISGGAWEGNVLFGFSVDDMVGLGFSLGVLSKKFQEEQTVYTQQLGYATESTVTHNFDSSILLLPMLFNVKVMIPLPGLIQPYGRGALGYEVLYNHQRDWVNDKKFNYLYGGFGWQLAAGGHINLGMHSGFEVELVYNHSKPQRNGTRKEGAPIRKEVNVSGIGIRFGITFTI